MTESKLDVFGPGFVPGKVTVSRDATSRALERNYDGVPEILGMGQADEEQPTSESSESRDVA